jgi:hypothetical protein
MVNNAGCIWIFDVEITADDTSGVIGFNQVFAFDLPCVIVGFARIPPIKARLKLVGRKGRCLRIILAPFRLRLLDEIAKAESVNPSYVSRVLRLSLLSPGTVDAILDGRYSPQLQALFRPFPTIWDEQANC